MTTYTVRVYHGHLLDRTIRDVPTRAVARSWASLWSRDGRVAVVGSSR